MAYLYGNDGKRVCGARSCFLQDAETRDWRMAPRQPKVHGATASIFVDNELIIVTLEKVIRDPAARDRFSLLPVPGIEESGFLARRRNLGGSVHEGCTPNATRFILVFCHRRPY